MDKKQWLVAVLMFAAMAVPSSSWGQGMNPANPRTPQKADPTEKQARIATEFVAKIKAVLPNGWSVKSEKNIIIVRREKPIEYYGTISLPSHDLAELKAQGFVHSANYTVILEFFPLMSKAAVDKLIEVNRRIEEQYYHEHPRPKNVKPSVSWELKQSLHHIPNVLAKNYSVLLTPFIQGPGLAFFNEQEKKECEGVEQELRRLLKADAKAAPIAPDNKTALQGVWIAQSMEMDGKPAPPATVKQMRFTFKGDRLLVRGNFDNDAEEKCEYKIDPGKSPKHIDIMPPKEKNPVLGIYRIKGDELRLFLRHADGPGGDPLRFLPRRDQT